MKLNLEKLAFQFNLPAWFIAGYGQDQRRWILTELPKNGKGAEIGVWKGEFSSRLLYAAKPRELHLIDPWKETGIVDVPPEWLADQKTRNKQYQEVCDRFKSDGRVYIHRGKSQEVLSKFKNNYLDWIYIDGWHSYEGVSSDLEEALRIVKPGGIIAGDDYHLKGWWKDGVIRAVNEVIQSGKVEAQIKGCHRKKLYT